MICLPIGGDSPHSVPSQLCMRPHRSALCPLPSVPPARNADWKRLMELNAVTLCRLAVALEVPHRRQIIDIGSRIDGRRNGRDGLVRAVSRVQPPSRGVQ